MKLPIPEVASAAEPWLDLPANMHLSALTLTHQFLNHARHCIFVFEKQATRSLTTSSVLLSAISDPGSQVQHQIRLGMHLEVALPNQHT